MAVLNITSYLLTATIISGIFLFYSTQKWIYGTRIDEIDKSILTDIFCTIFTTIFSLLVLILAIKKKAKDIVILCLSGIIAFQGFYEFYRGFFLFFDSSAFIAQLGYHWINQPKSKLVKNISKTFSCCGFYSVSDFPSIKCNIQNPVSCSSVLNEILGPTIHTTGTIMIGQAAAHFVAAFSLFCHFMATSQRIAH